MKIAVTGASGFVGRHVLTALLEHKVEVVAVTRDITRLSGLSDSIDVVTMDMAHPEPDCFDRLGNPEVLIHLAWDGLPHYMSLHHFETELPRHYRFIKAMVVAGLPSVLVAGTCQEYGMQSGPLSEDLRALPGTPYSLAKDALRRQLEFLKATRPFELTWARLFYLYGEGQPKSCLYRQLKDAEFRREPTFNMSGGEQLRDYLPAAEVGRMIARLAMTAKGKPSVVNICSGQPISVRRMVEQWILTYGWKIRLNLGHYPYPDYEPMAFWGDRQRLEWFLTGI
jgi:nucleoside-diphosphate-sugar epimerase